MLMGETASKTLSSFVDENETRLRNALTARFGSDVGREAAAESLAHGWEHWDRLHSMDDPIAYLYAVGKDRRRRTSKSRHVVLPTVPVERAPPLEPGLPQAVADLPDRHRVVVLLLHGYDWTHSEIAEVLDISRSSVKRHGDRAIETLERNRGVNSPETGRSGSGGAVTDVEERSMTVDLQDQLHELCAVIDEEQGAITEEDVRTRTDAVMVIGGTTSPLPPTIRRRWWPIAAATATVIVAASLPFLVLSDNEEPALVNPTPSNGWSRVLNEHDVFGGAGNQRMVAITEGGPGFVAVGSDYSLGSERGAVWTSVDGLTWDRVPEDDTDFGTAADESITDTTSGGPGVVAVGSICEMRQIEYYEDGYQEEYCVDRVAAVWTSVDGVTWARVPHDDSIFGGKGDVGMASVTVGGPGLVAVGSDASDDGQEWFGQWTAEAVVVWTSVDGLTWSRVPHDDEIFGEAEVQSVTVGGPGLVAVGLAPFATRSVAAVWTSPDGLSWSRVAYTRKAFGSGLAVSGSSIEMSSVTAGGPGLVAVGGPESAALVWTSVDGITWSQVPPDADFIGPGDQSIRSIVAGGPGLVAVGTEGFQVPSPSVQDGQSSYEQIVVVWTSRDGINWSRVPHNESVFGGGDVEMVDVVADGSNLIAVGSVCTETEVHIYDDGYREERCVDRDAVVWRTNN
jgi:DNA-directed RNA polymerase specialized sigma24 family protein